MRAGTQEESDLDINMIAKHFRKSEETGAMQMLNQTFPLPNSNEIYMLPLGSFITLFEMSDLKKKKKVSDTVVALHCCISFPSTFKDKQLCLIQYFQ